MLTTAFHCLLLFGKHIFCHVSQKWGLRPAHPGCTDVFTMVCAQFHAEYIVVPTVPGLMFGGRG